jgi:cyclophilin family peptidyl-prolyl cis-trans isomerase
MLFVVLALAACGGSSSTGASPTTPLPGSACIRVVEPAPTQRTAKPPTSLLDTARTYEVMVRTNCGSFTIRVATSESPHAAASFVALAKGGFFDHTIFNRIVPGVLIQGGDPTATGTGGPGYTTLDTPAPTATYGYGVVAMAKTGTQRPGTAGSQFFIVTAKKVDLPPDYAIIGEVVKGMDVVDGIGTLGGGSDLPNQVQNTSGVPTQIVEVERATVATT